MKQLLLVGILMIIIFCDILGQKSNDKKAYRSFEEAMKEPQKVKFLILDSADQNQIRNLEVLKYLERLMIKNFSMDTLSSEVLCCSKLRELGIFNSNIHFLPKNIGKIKKLETIIIFETSLKNLPNSLFEIYGLNLLLLYRTEIPDSILYQLDERLSKQTTIIAKDFQVQGKLE